MTTFNTGNAVPSADARDRFDNSQTFDEVINGTLTYYVNRVGNNVLSLKGVADQFNADQLARSNEYTADKTARDTEFAEDQSSREAAFDQFLEGTGWSSLGAYAVGISIVSHTQTVDYLGQPYSLKPSIPASLDAPYVTTGVWATEGVNFKLVGDNSLRQELGDPEFGSDLIQYQLRHLADAVPESVSMRLDQTVHLWSFLTPNQRNNVKARLGTMDCSDAWDKMLAALVTPGPFVYPVSPRICMPEGVIYFASERIVRQRIHLVGYGAGQSGGNYLTTIKFPVDSAGLTFIKGNTGPTTNGSDSSILEGLFITGQGLNSGTADRTKHGIDMRARIKIVDCTITGFTGNGVNIVADVSAKSNANLWVMDTVTIEANGMHGMYVQGGDTNAGVATLVNSNNNNRSGIFDDSFLGNTYTACHTAGNGRKSQCHYEGNRYYCVSDTLGGSTIPGTNSAVWVLVGPGVAHTLYPDWVLGNEYFTGYCFRSTNANARNVFLGCYSEGSQPPARLMRPCVVVGGIITGGGAGITPDSNGLIISGGGAISDFLNDPRSDYYFEIGAVAQKAAIVLHATGDSTNGISLQWDTTSGVWVWKWANATQFQFMTTGKTTVNAGRSAPVAGGTLGLVTPFIMGSGNGARHFGRAYWTSGVSNPTSGEFAKGDTYLFASTAPGAKIGITCTTAGTAGTTAVFRQWGAIDA